MDFIKRFVPDDTDSIDDFGNITKYVIMIVIKNVTNTFIFDFSHI